MQLLDLTLDSIAADLALEEALLQSIDERPDAPPLLRFWVPSPHAVVLGASGRWRDELDAEACEADGVPIARRASGGGTVVVGPGALNVSVFHRIDAHPELKTVESAQSWVMGRIGRAIREAGRAVVLRGSGDLALGDRKISGSAQRRLRRSVLVHATILDAFPLDRIDRYLRQPKRQPAYRLDRDHASFVANLNLGLDSLKEAIGREWLGGQPPAKPEIPWTKVDEYQQSTFSDPAWVRRL